MAKLTEKERAELRNQLERDRAAREHELKKLGLVAGVLLTILAMVASVIFSTIGADHPGYISGTVLAIIAGIIAVAVIFYFAIVYGRALIFRSKNSPTVQQLDLTLGDDKKAEQ